MIKERLIFLLFCLSFLLAGTFTTMTESVYSADDEIIDQIKKDGPGNRFAITRIQPLKGHKFGGYKPITFTDNSIEGDLICVADGMSAAGNGTAIRFINKITFRDEVANLGQTKVYLPKNINGFIFESQTDSPLSFVLLENYGLVYVSGHGSVIYPDNQTVKLPSGDLKSEETPGITFDSDKISTTGAFTGSDYKGNYVYSGAMNLAWNELNENILHEKLKLNTTDKKALEIVDTFNKTIFTKNDLDEASYYVKSGFRQKTVDIINKESRSKFPDKSFGDLKVTLQEKDIIAYAYFLKKVEYATPFVTNNVSFMGERIKGFCAKTKEQKANVEVLKYSDDNKFVIRLKLKDDSDELILAKGFDISSPEDIVDEIRKYDIHHLPAIGDSDLFEMPKLYLSHSRDYNEVIRKYLVNKGFEKYRIEVMQENMKFYMDEKGARVENEAVVAMQKKCEVVKKGRYFVLNKPFWVVMKRENSRNPYFILGVNNTELMERNIEIASTSGDNNGAVMPATITDTGNDPESQTANEKQPHEPVAPKEIAISQGLDITVPDGKKDEKVPVEGAGVYLDGKEVGATDKSGELFINEADNENDERREKLRKEDASRFETVKKDIDHSAQGEKISEIVRKFSETYPCSERLSELDRYAESRIEAITRMIAEKRDNSGEIKVVLNDIHEAIRERNGEAFCRFLSKENDGFYSRERKIIEEFTKEIQVHNSSFDDINIAINGNTASVQYAWSMDFTWNAFPGKKFENKSRISLKLKKTNNEWKIFDAAMTNSNS